MTASALAVDVPPGAATAHAPRPLGRPTAATAPAGTVAPAGDYLTFRLGREHYGIDILRVQEIRSYEEPTRLAQAPDFIKGVINLRGNIVPILDLRVKLGCAEVQFNDFTVVVILDLGDLQVGAVVDAVADVVTLAPEHIRPAPRFGPQDGLDASFITGIASLDQRMLILVSIDALLSSEELGLVQSATAA